ncbi:hypothetical protein Trydic_g12494 [Trypoxylus dichotomus]
MTPVANAAAGSPDVNYNSAHATARSIIERESRVTECIVLHNLCIGHNVPFRDEEAQEIDILPQEIVHNLGTANDLLNEG